MQNWAQLDTISVVIQPWVMKANLIFGAMLRQKDIPAKRNASPQTTPVQPSHPERMVEQMEIQLSCNFRVYHLSNLFLISIKVIVLKSNSINYRRKQKNMIKKTQRIIEASNRKQKKAQNAKHGTVKVLTLIKRRRINTLKVALM